MEEFIICHKRSEVPEKSMEVCRSSCRQTFFLDPVRLHFLNLETSATRLARVLFVHIQCNVISNHLNLTQSNANTVSFDRFWGSGGLLEKTPRPLYDWWDAEMKGGFDVAQHSLALLNHVEPCQTRPANQQRNTLESVDMISVHSRNTIVT